MQSASGLLDPPVLAPVSVPGCAVFLWRLFMGFIHSRSCIAFPFYCWKKYIIFDVPWTRGTT